MRPVIIGTAAAFVATVALHGCEVNESSKAPRMFGTKNPTLETLFKAHKELVERQTFYDEAPGYFLQQLDYGAGASPQDLIDHYWENNNYCVVKGVWKAEQDKKESLNPEFSEGCKKPGHTTQADQRVRNLIIALRDGVGPFEIGSGDLKGIVSESEQSLVVDQDFERFLKGDVILKVDGKSVTTKNELDNLEPSQTAGAKNESLDVDADDKIKSKSMLKVEVRRSAGTLTLDIRKDILEKLKYDQDKQLKDQKLTADDIDIFKDVDIVNDLVIASFAPLELTGEKSIKIGGSALIVVSNRCKISHGLIVGEGLNVDVRKNTDFSWKGDIIVGSRDASEEEKKKWRGKADFVFDAASAASVAMVGGVKVSAHSHDETKPKDAQNQQQNSVADGKPVRGNDSDDKNVEAKTLENRRRGGDLKLTLGNDVSWNYGQEENISGDDLEKLEYNFDIAGKFMIHVPTKGSTAGLPKEIKIAGSKLTLGQKLDITIADNDSKVKFAFANYDFRNYDENPNICDVLRRADATFEQLPKPKDDVKVQCRQIPFGESQRTIWSAENIIDN